MKPLTQEFCATIAGNDPTKTKYRQIDDNLYDNFCYDKHHNNIGSIVIQCGLPSEQTLNFDNITDQLISQVQKGNQDAINLLNSINQAIEQEKKASAITTQPKPSVPVVKPAPPQTDADAKPKEESKTDQAEKPDPDKEKCRSEINDIEEHIRDVLEYRYCDMLIDRKSLFSRHKKKSNPHPDGKSGSWEGHIEQYNIQREQVLNEKMVKLRMANNGKCNKYMPKEAEKWRWEPPPERPSQTKAEQLDCPRKMAEKEARDLARKQAEK